MRIAKLTLLVASVLPVLVTLITSSILTERIANNLTSHVNTCRDRLNLSRLLQDADTAVSEIVKSTLNALPQNYPPVQKTVVSALVKVAIDSLTVKKDSELARLYSLAHKADSNIISNVAIVTDVLFYVSIALLTATVVASIVRTAHLILIGWSTRYYKAQTGQQTKQQTGQQTGKQGSEKQEKTSFYKGFAWVSQILAYTIYVLILALSSVCACIDAYVFNNIQSYVQILHCSFSSDMITVGVLTAVFSGITLLTILFEPILI
jgi:hypothetical protein